VNPEGLMSDLVEILPMVLIMTAVGAFSGVIAGLLGVGGGIVLVPAFFYIFTAMGFGGPQLMQVCVATSLATIIFTSVRSVRGHNRKGAVDLDLLRAFAPGLIAGAFVGVFAALYVSSFVLQLVFGVLGALVGLHMAFGKADWRLADAVPKGGLRHLLSAPLAFVSVLMGIGGGTFGVPLMTLYGMPIHRAVGTASGFGVLIAVPSVLVFLVSPLTQNPLPPFQVGAVNIPTFLLVIVVSYVTTPYGVRLAHALDPKPLKRVFGIFLMITALNMLRKAVLVYVLV
jgi:uncharacterized protein